MTAGAAAREVRRADREGRPTPFIFGLTRGILSGVDVFVTSLVRWLVGCGEDARILFTSQIVEDPPPDVPYDVLDGSPEWDWHRRWAAFREYLAWNSPAIFVANYDTEYSVGLFPLLGNVRVVLTVQSDDPQHYGHVLMAGRAAERIVAVSTCIADQIAVMAPELRERTVVIPNGVDVPPALRVRDAAKRPLRAIYAGRIVARQKNVPALVRMVSAIRDVESLTLVGEGSGEDSLFLWSMVREFALHHIPTLPNALVRLQYASHDVALLNSTYEGLPLMILEAMSHGCIPVCRYVRSGLPELIDHGRNGFFFESPEELAAVCRTLSTDGPLRRRVSEAAYETIVTRESGVHRPFTQYRSLLNELARDWSGCRPQVE